MLNLSRAEIEAVIDLHSAATAIEQAYRATSLGQVTLPPVGHITFPELSGDCHIKYGHMQGDENFVIKVATGFPKNSDQRLPTGNGLLLVMSAQTGAVNAVLHDEMLLTDIRTGLGAAIASKHLARQDSKRLLVVGTGSQSIWQIKAHVALMPQLEHIEIWGRSSEKAQHAIDQLPDGYEVSIAENLAQSAQDANIIVTATGATSALIRSEWVRAGTHITAVGADAPGKQELDVALVRRADLLVVDLISQCADHGEVSHAISGGLVTPNDLIELGDVLLDPTKGRQTDADITIADLTGIAAQDIAIANAVLASYGG